MPSITCPRCGSSISYGRAFNIGNKPFCARCGWNLARAEASLDNKSAFVKLIPIGIAAFIAFFLFTSAGSGAPFVFIVPGIFLLLALAPVWNYYASRKAILAAKSTANPDLALAQPPLDPQLQILQSLPRPRKTRFRFVGAFGAAFAAIFVMALGGFVAYILAAPRRSSGNAFDLTLLLPFGLMAVVVAAVIAIPLARERRNAPLLRDGELAFGRVVLQRTVQQGKASYSSIDYEFKTNSGLQIRRTARDLTNSVFEDMTIPVFYDPVNPEKNITPCATYLRLSADSL